MWLIFCYAEVAIPYTGLLLENMARQKYITFVEDNLDYIIWVIRLRVCYAQYGTISKLEENLSYFFSCMYDNMFLRDRLPVNSSDKNRFKSAEDMLNENSRLIQAVAEPLANYFADWFFTKQLLRVTENHNNRTSLEQLLENNQIVRMRCIRYVTSTSGHECLYLLQSMLFIVLGIDMYGKNLSTYEFSTDDIAIAESLLNKLAEELNYLNQWHQLYFHLAQAKFLSITGNISKSIEYLEAAEALVHGYNECQTMMRCCLDTFIETLHAEDQRLGERTEKRATSKRDSTTVSLDKATCKAKERDNAHSEWKTEVLTGAAKGETFFFYVYETQPLLKKGKHLPRTLVQQALHIALQSKHLPIACELRLSVALYIRKSDAGDIFDVWPAYEEKNPWDPIFVVMTYSNIQGEWGNVFGFRVFKRRYDFVSSEAAIVINSKAVTENPLDFSDFDKLKKVTRSRKVIKKHSNITIMNACSCRSKRGGKEICKETCVVIHCLVKGLIPYLEGPFPRSISGIPVDVREGYVTMGMNVHIPQDIQYHSMCEMMQNLDLVGPSIQAGSRSTDINQKLLMGTTISKTGSNPLTGTLGGFVRLPTGDMGFLTCAHVVGLNKDQTVSQPSHAELPPSHRSPKTICGQVERVVFAPGGCDETGIDAAVVKISKRQPTDGAFIWVSPESQAAAGFSSALKFTSGKVLVRDELKDNRRTDVIKVGSQSGLTRGSLYLTETFVRINNREMILPGGERVEFYNQMEIQSHAGSKAFFELGDSGSLVFMALRNDELHCLGLAIGKTSYSSCLVTPISAVLDKLGLRDQLLQFGVLNDPLRNGFHLPNGRL